MWEVQKQHLFELFGWYITKRKEAYYRSLVSWEINNEHDKYYITEQNVETLVRCFSSEYYV